MKIMGNVGVYNTYDKSAKKNNNDKSQVAGNKVARDKVEISSNAINQNTKSGEVEYLKAKLNSTEDREARIAELKAQIAAGTYKVSSEDVAEAILESKKV